MAGPIDIAPFRRMQLKAAVACTATALCVLLPLLWLAWRAWCSLGAAPILGALLCCELSFMGFYFLILVPKLNQRPEQHSPADHEPEAVMASFLEHMERVQDFEHFICSWFLDAPLESIKVDNAKELLAYAIWYKSLDQMEAAGLTPHLDRLISRLQAMHSLALPPGYNPHLRFMSHLWEDVPHIYRPLVFYLVMELLEVLGWAMLVVNGFQPHWLPNGALYYTRGLPGASLGQRQQQQGKEGGSSGQGQGQRQQQQQQREQHGGSHHRSSGSDSSHISQNSSRKGCTTTTTTSSSSSKGVPVVLLHGVGAGLLPYMGVALQLAATGHPLVLPVFKQVSMRVMMSIPSVEEAADDLIAALAAHGVDRAAIIGHSYGTTIAAVLVKKRPELVHTLALIDPVCLAMYMPNLLKFFLYSSHVCGSRLADFLIALLSSEVHCATNFCRNFFWTSINLWDEHLPHRTLVVLSGRDILCPTLHVRCWLESHPRVQVLFNPSVAHGAGLLLNLAWQRRIISDVVEMMQRPDGEAEGSVGELAAAAAAAEGAAAAATGGAAGRMEVVGDGIATKDCAAAGEEAVVAGGSAAGLLARAPAGFVCSVGGKQGEDGREDIEVEEADLAGFVMTRDQQTTEAFGQALHPKAMGKR